MMPSSTYPQMPGTKCSSSPITMWQLDVPMMITMRPGSATVAAGTATWASTLAMATAVPGFRPVHSAACSVNPPAFCPSSRMSSDSFSSTKFSRRGSSALKNALGGKPSRLDHMPL